MSSTQASNKMYLIIGGWLAALMLLGVAMAEFPTVRETVSKPIVIAIVLVLSTVKAILVGMYYMHLKFDRRWLAFVALFPILLIALAVLVVLSSRLITL